MVWVSKNMNDFGDNVVDMISRDNLYINKKDMIIYNKVFLNGDEFI